MSVCPSACHCQPHVCLPGRFSPTSVATLSATSVATLARCARELRSVPQLASVRVHFCVFVRVRMCLRVYGHVCVCVSVSACLNAENKQIDRKSIQIPLKHRPQKVEIMTKNRWPPSVCISVCVHVRMCLRVCGYACVSVSVCLNAKKDKSTKQINPNFIEKSTQKH